MAMVIGGGSVTGLTGATISGNLSVTGTANITQGIASAGLYTSGTANVAQGLSTVARGIATASVPTGSIIQVVSAIKTDTYTSGTSETWLDLTGMTATITPTSATSKIIVHVFVGRHYGTNSVVWRVLRNSGLYNAGDAASNRQQVHAAESNQGRDANHTGQVIIGYVDSPATTSAVTYQLQFKQEGTNFTFNRNGNDSDITNSYSARSSSSIILMEIAQ